MILSDYSWLDPYIEEENRLNGKEVMKLIHDVAEAEDKFGNLEDLDDESNMS